jgi:DNA polymerase III delta prime subunit
MSPAQRFSGLLGNTRTLQALSRALDENRLSPALLFHGPAGVGKLTSAVELARHLLCPSSEGSACGVCDSCRRVNAASLLHPDLGVLYPQKKEDASEKAAADSPLPAPDLHSIQEEARNNASWRILADPARERLSQLFLSPSQGRRRILLVLAAERLQEESGNAFLKVLEEYKKAPEVTRKRMYLETMERVLGGTDKIIIDSKNTQGIVPFFSLDQLQPRKEEKK